MRVFVLFTASVVFAMHSHPLFGNHRSGQPEPKAHHVTDGRVEIDAAVSLAAV
jgi:hypothetical protein